MIDAVKCINKIMLNVFKNVSSLSRQIWSWLIVTMIYRPPLISRNVSDSNTRKDNQWIKVFIDNVRAFLPSLISSPANIQGPCCLLVTDTLRPSSRSITHSTQARFDTSVCLLICSPSVSPVLWLTETKLSVAKDRTVPPRCYHLQPCLGPSR